MIKSLTIEYLGARKGKQMKRPWITLGITMLIVLLVLVACYPASVDDSQRIVITEEPVINNNYCEQIYDSGFARWILRCEYNEEICYIANGPESVSIDCFE